MKKNRKEVALCIKSSKTRSSGGLSLTMRLICLLCCFFVLSLSSFAVFADGYTREETIDSEDIVSWSIPFRYIAMENATTGSLLYDFPLFVLKPQTQPNANFDRGAHINNSAYVYNKEFNYYYSTYLSSDSRMITELAFPFYSAYYYRLEASNFVYRAGSRIDVYPDYYWELEGLQITYSYTISSLQSDGADMVIANDYYEETVTIDNSITQSFSLVAPDLLNGVFGSEVIVSGYTVSFSSPFVTNQTCHISGHSFEFDDLDTTSWYIDNQNSQPTSILDWLFNSISGIMNFEIFPNFSIGIVLMIFASIGGLIAILRLFAGG